MAQALSATGAVAGALVRARPADRDRGSTERGEAEIDVAALHALAEEVLLAEEGETAARRYAAGAGSTGSTARSSC